MKNLKYILILSLLFAVPAVLLPVSLTQAADVSTTNNITYIELTDPAMTLELGVGSTYDSMTVETSYVEFSVPGDSWIRLTSQDAYKLTNSLSEVVACNSDNSSVHYYNPAGSSSQTIRFTPTTDTCAGSGGGGGGGGSSSSSTKISKSSTTSQSVAKTVNAANGGFVSTTDARAKMTIPVNLNLVSGNISMNISPKASSGYTAPVVGYKALANQVFGFSMTSGGIEMVEFSSPVTLTFKYTEADISGINEDTLKVYWWDEANNKWQSLGGTVNKASNMVTVEVGHFSVFGLFGKQVSVSAGGGDLIKLTCLNGAGANDPCRSVYYLGSNNQRYVFPNEKTFYSWYLDFSNVKEVSGDVMASYQIGGNVTMRPGTNLIKITTNPKVYAVEPGGVLRWVNSEATAIALYGSSWNTKIVDVPDTFFLDYDAAQAEDNPVADTHPTGTLIKYAGSDSKYYITSGNAKRLFTTDAMFTGNGFRDEFVLETNIIYTDGINVSVIEAVLSATAGP